MIDSIAAYVPQLTAKHWSIAVALLFVVFLFVWFERQDRNGFVFADAFKGPDGHASGNGCLLWIFAIIAIWQIMFGVFAGQDMSGLTRDALGILALGKAAGQWAAGVAAKAQAIGPAIAAPGSDIRIEAAPAPTAPARKRGRVDVPAGG